MASVILRTTECAPTFAVAGNQPNQFLAFAPAILTQSQPGSQNVVRHDAITDMRPDNHQNRTVRSQLGPQRRHHTAHPRRVFLFGHAAVLPFALHGIRWRREDKANAAIRQRGNERERIAADNCSRFRQV